MASYGGGEKAGISLSGQLSEVFRNKTLDTLPKPTLIENPENCKWDLHIEKSDFSWRRFWEPGAEGDKIA